MRIATKPFLETDASHDDLVIAKMYLEKVQGGDRFVWQTMEPKKMGKIIKKLIDSPFLTKPIRAKLEALPLIKNI